MSVATILSIIEIANAASPGIIQLVGVITKKTDGTAGVLLFLDEADSKFSANMEQIMTWANAHPTTKQ